MPYFGLFIKADLENIAKLKFPMEEMHWTLDVQQSAGVDIRERVTVWQGDVVDVPNSTGTANFIIKWDGAKAASTMSVLVPTKKLEKEIKDLKKATLWEYSEQSNGAEALVAIFECRGVEPVKFYPTGGIMVECSDGKQIEYDQEDYEMWCEVDDNSTPVSIDNLEYSFKVVK